MKISRSTLVPLCTAKVSIFMAKLGARAPRTRYIGRSVTANERGDLDSGVIRTICSFLTPSGFERELEIPVLMQGGELVTPEVAMVRGNPTPITRELIESIGAAGTIMGKMPPGHIYSTAYSGDPSVYRELCDRIEARPILYRPLF